MSKPILIIFEGCDKTGKTTLSKEFNKITNHKYLVLDRFIISDIVYDIAFNRKYDNNTNKYNSYKILSESFDIVIILCKSNVETIHKRLYEHKEILPDELIEIPKIEFYFRDTINKLYKYYDCNFTLLTLDTGIFNINECIKMIQKVVSRKECETDESRWE